MSRKLVVLPYTDPSINAASMASNINGTPINIQYADNACVQVVWTGSSPLGQIKFQVSTTWNNALQTGTWTTIQTQPGTDFSIVPGGSAGDYFVDLNELGAPWFRIIYLTAGGSVGNLTATFGAKSI